MTRFQFLKVWREWDRVMSAMPPRPGKRFGERETHAMETACVTVCPFGTTRFRAELAAGRRAGLDYPDALDRAYGVVVPGKN